MSNRLYLGHLVSGTRRKASFKSKREIKQSEEKWIVVENTHPPIISQQLWDDAHQRLGTRKRTGKLREPHIFAGLIKCDICGYALCMSNAKSHADYFCCNTYKKKGKEVCTNHYIPYSDLYEVVFKDLKKHIAKVQHDENGFVKRILRLLGNNSENKQERIIREIKLAEKRIRELDDKFNKLYDDRLEGMLSDNRFRELSARCEDEQAKLKTRLEELKSQVNQQEETENNVSRFVDEAKRYSNIKKLDREILNRLIDKIVVSDSVTENGVKTQKIRIFYKFLGDLA